MANPQTALAQTPSAQHSSPRTPDARQRYDIPAGPLAPALRSLASAANLLLTFTADQTDGKTTAGVSGQYAWQEALAALLVGSGLQAVRLDNGGYVLRTVPVAPAAAKDGEAVLPAVTVRAAAERETATGPVDGYVAKRSATGTKTDTSIIETPQSISVVTRKQIDDQAAQSVRQALRYTPGVISEYRGAGGSRYDTVIYRGFGGGINYDYSHLDGMRLLGVNYAVPQIDIYNLERVDVLRGPASVLYGQGTPGGMINLVSKRPTAEPLREVGVQVGSNKHVEGVFDFGGPIAGDDRLLYRLTGKASATDSQVESQKERRTSLASALTWQPDKDTSFTLFGKYQYDPDGGYYGFLPAVGTVLPLPNGQYIPRKFFDGSPGFDAFERRQSSIGYELKHRFNDMWSMESQLRYMHADFGYKSVFTSGTDLANPTHPLLKRRAIVNDAHFDAITADNHAKAEFDTGGLKHTVLVGIDYQRLDYDEVQGLGGAPSLSILKPNYGLPIATPAINSSSKQDLEQIGLYAQDQIRIGRLTLLGGMRQDWTRNDRRNRLTETKIGQRDDAFTWRVGGVYQFESGIAPYASYATSFQPVADADVNGNLFKPTTGKQVEVGVKFEPTGYNAFFTASAYELTQQNVLTTDPNNTSFSIQTGEVRSRGFELEAHANVLVNLELIASYSHMDNVNTRSTTAPGFHPTYVPDQTAAFWANYTFGAGALDGLSIGGGLRYVGGSYANATNTIRVPDFTLVDAAIRYDFGKKNPRLKGLTLAVNAANLLDKDHVSACATATKCFYGAGRAVNAALNYRW